MNRDFADAIYHEVISDECITVALEAWHEHPEWGEYQRMLSVLAYVTGRVLDEVLARRQREAARTGPWEGA